MRKGGEGEEAGKGERKHTADLGCDVSGEEDPHRGCLVRAVDLQ